MSTYFPNDAPWPRLRRTLALALNLRGHRIAVPQATSAQESDFIRSLHDHSVTLGRTLPFILENAACRQLGLMPPCERPALPNVLGLINRVPPGVGPAS